MAMSYTYRDNENPYTVKRNEMISVLGPNRAEIALGILASMMPSDPAAVRAHTPAMMLNYAQRAVDQTDALIASLLNIIGTGNNNGWPLRTVRHRKSGGIYEVIGEGKMQAEKWCEFGGDSDPSPSIDMREVVIYRAQKDGTLWVRPKEEFEDGRFEDVTSEGQENV